MMSSFRLFDVWRPRLPSACGASLALILTAVPFHLQGQETRAQLLEAARAEFNDARAIELLLEAAEPGGMPLDSLWAVGVHELAFALWRAGDEAAAELWLRWAARHGGDWPLDRRWFPPPVVAVWERAVARVSESSQPPDAGVATSWRWGSVAAAGVRGRLEAEAIEAGVPIEVALEGPTGRELLAISELGERHLSPGTYSVSGGWR